MLLADFHIHTTWSDGKLSIAEVVDLFGRAGHDAIAITDHVVNNDTLIDEAALGGFPLLITENGLADGSDRLRPDFLRMHAEEIRKAEARGIPIHGYFHWSLLDNYEWLDGYEPRFGLYSVDRETMHRTPRGSVEVFRDLGRDFTRSLPLAQPPLHIAGAKS